LYDFNAKDISGQATDGLIIKVKPVTPGLKSLGELESGYQSVNDPWFATFLRDGNSGVYYPGTDLNAAVPEVGVPIGGMLNKTDKISVDQLRRVELRFGGTHKAYRYLNGFIGNSFTRRRSFIFAEGVTESDTAGTGIGKFGQGFVDVPFSAWVVDDKHEEEYQLATAFVEASKLVSSKANPDGLWDPDTVLFDTKEVIVIFNSPYDPNGGNKIYTGGAFGSETQWSDIIQGYDIPDGASGITEEQREIAKTPYFDAMYVVCLPHNKLRPDEFYTDGDILPIELAAYPYTEEDKFEFTTSKGGTITETAQKDMFNKINVFPNPLFAHNPATSYDPNLSPDDAFVTFTNLPEEVSIKIYSLSGILLKTLGTDDKEMPGSTMLKWDLKNESDLRVASGMYIALVESPGFGQKILKIALIMPQKQLQRF
jgi:hypothetical protein